MMTSAGARTTSRVLRTAPRSLYDGTPAPSTAAFAHSAAHGCADSNTHARQARPTTGEWAMKEGLQA